jgi:hypothetical protein
MRTGVPPCIDIILCIDCIKMSCNNFHSFFGSHFGQPSTHHNRKCHNSCKPQCTCKIKCESICTPCQPVCTPCQSVCTPCQPALCTPCQLASTSQQQLLNLPHHQNFQHQNFQHQNFQNQQNFLAIPHHQQQFVNSCHNSFNNPCHNPCQNICQNPCPPCPIVTFVSNIATPTVVPSGGILIPAGTTIPLGTTTVPPGTVTVIAGFTGAPTSNCGGILLNNGFFTVPLAGRYVISANVCFDIVTTVSPTDFRELDIYRVDHVSGIVTLLATDSRPPIAGSPTCVNIATVADLNSGDRIFIAARQLNTTTGTSVSTIANTGRFAITRVC